MFVFEKSLSFKHRNLLCPYMVIWAFLKQSLQWRHNGQDSVSNHQPHDCLLNRLFKRRSEKTSKLRVTGLCAMNSPGTVNSPHKWPVSRKMFPFDDVIMIATVYWTGEFWYCQGSAATEIDPSFILLSMITNRNSAMHESNWNTQP